MINNLFANVTTSPTGELVDILRRDPVRIERIVSSGQASPLGFWYEQDEHEWVLVLQGAARLRFEDETDPIELCVGSFIDIPRGRRHRVEWTAPDEPTIWLAIFWKGDLHA